MNMARTNMVHPVKYGRNERQSFSKIDEILDMPNLIAIQKNSYKKFIDEGLKEVFKDISPISDYDDKLELEFVDYKLEDTTNYTIDECKERDTTYAAPLNVKVRLHNKTTGEIKEQKIFFGDFPLMTDNGTFILNGAERVIVSQLVRSPGAYYEKNLDKVKGKYITGSTFIPNRGAWLEFEIDYNDTISVRIDRNRKLPVTVLFRALGYASNDDLLELFGEDERILNTLEKDTTTTAEEALVEIYKKLRPGEPPTVDSAKNLLFGMFFDARRYDLARVGRYKFNKKLSIAARIKNQIAAEDIVDPKTGEILVDAKKKITPELAVEIQNAGINVVMIDTPYKPVKVIGNNTVELAKYVKLDNPDLELANNVYYPALMELKKQAKNKEELRELVVAHSNDLVPKHLTIDDIIAGFNYILGIEYDIGHTDDIDHLGNRRIRSVGELLQN